MPFCTRIYVLEMSKPYICPKCGHRYSTEEHSEDSFCRECEKRMVVWTKAKEWLRHPIGDVANKRSFVEQLYSNVATVADLTLCDRCYDMHWRERRLDNFPHKPCFPPVGSSKVGQVLFIGTNPRCKIGTENEDFYRHALVSPANFLQFSIDGRYRDSSGNLRWLFDHPHYRIHKKCLAEVDPSWVLGRKSSVTELFMCGSENANIFSEEREYACAEEYLTKYFGLVRPRIVVCLGSLVLRWFQKKYGNDLRRNMKYPDGTVSKSFAGNPLRSGMSELHACFSEVGLDSGYTSTVIFSNHPNAWGFDESSLFKTFRFAARKAGFLD